MMQTNASFSSIIILVKDDLSNIQEMSAPYDEKTQTNPVYRFCAVFLFFQKIFYFFQKKMNLSSIFDVLLDEGGTIRLT